ncbi:hypothetical protein N8371_05365 [Vicingaceae bacterium]|nr:hypothetical protein [Vicingaceae bacterium]MDB4062359.1 hypothetical protein [Vicingaceae bacterium]MDC1451821.1 hypothetical protein [Vicingaceae bacterium]
MNLKSFKVAAAAIAMVGMVFTACSGEDGDIGPAGANGNANVNSFSYTVDAASWSQGRANISLPQLTKAIADNGVVAVFGSFDSLGTDTISWRPVPYRFVANVGGTNMLVSITNTFSVGQVSLFSNLTSTNAGINLFTSTFRVVLIPSSAKIEGVNINNYEEVKTVYGVEEFEVL